MMTKRIAVISDVHANAAALRAVFDDVRRQGCEEVWMLGDAIGYGHQPQETLELLIDAHPTFWLLGNHDAGLLSLCEPRPQNALDMDDGWNDVARHTIRRAYLRLQDQSVYLDALADLAYCVNPEEWPNFFLAHGGYYPGDLDKSVLTRYAWRNRPRVIEEDYQKNPSWRERCQQYGYVLVLYGHTHEPFVRRRPVGQSDSDGLDPNCWELLSLKPSDPVEISPGYVYNANPGSAGGWVRENHGNEGRSCPTYLLLNVDSKRIELELHVVAYDSEEVRQQMREYQWPRRVWDLDYRGEEGRSQSPLLPCCKG